MTDLLNDKKPNRNNNNNQNRQTNKTNKNKNKQKKKTIKNPHQELINYKNYNLLINFLIFF